MDSYFAGKKISGPYTFSEGKSHVTYTATASWYNVGRSITLRCGQNGEMEYTRTAGIETNEMERLRSQIEATIGLEGVASLKSQVEASLQTSVSFSESTSESDVFQLSAPACGNQTSYIYQLHRNHHFVIQTPRFLRKPSIVSHQVNEATHHYDLRLERDPHDPACPCESAKTAKGSEVLAFKIGKLTLRVDAFWRSKNELEFSIGNEIITARLISNSGFFRVDHFQIPAEISFFAGSDGLSTNLVAEIVPDFIPTNMITNVADSSEGVVSSTKIIDWGNADDSTQTDQ